MPFNTNTATWTSADYKAATAAQVATLTTAQVAAMAHADWLTPAAFGGFSAAQVAAVSISWNWMSAAQINAITPAALAGLSATAIAQLSATTVSGLDAGHLAALGTAQIAAFASAQIRALGGAQIAALTAAQIAALKIAQIDLFTAAQIGALGAKQVAALTTAQLATLSAAQVAGIGAAGAAGLTTAQLAALGMAIRGLGTAAIAALAPATIGALTGWQLADLTVAQIGALTTGQIITLTAAKVARLSPGQLQALGIKVQAFVPAALAGLGQAGLLAVYTRLSASQLAALSAAQAAEVALAKSVLATLIGPATAGGLTSAGLLAPVTALIASGQSLFSYQGLLSVLKAAGGAIGTGGLTAAQLADLKTLAKAVGTVTGTGSYLAGVLGALVNGNAANATWTGGAMATTPLGNLAVGSTATQFTELLGKWFLGTDLPSWSTTSATVWTTRTGDLFGTAGPVSTDPVQGGIGDCYLIAAMVEVAKDQPGLIASMFTDNGNGTVGVRMYAPGGKPVYFTVNGQVPANGWTAGTANGSLWTTLLEKAFVAWRNEVHGNAYTYDAINGGWSDGLTAITGKAGTNYISAYTASQTAWDTTVKNAVIAALQAGQEVLFGSFIDDKDAANGKTDLVSDHEFAVTGFDTATGNFILQNPWGAAGGSSWNGVFEQSIDQLWGGTTGNGASSGFIVAKGTSPAGATSAAYAAAQLAQAIAATPQSAGTLLPGSLMAAAQGNGPGVLHLAAHAA